MRVHRACGITGLDERHTQGVTTDCLTCFVTAPNLADEIQRAAGPEGLPGGMRLRAHWVISKICPKA